MRIEPTIKNWRIRRKFFSLLLIAAIAVTFLPLPSHAAAPFAGGDGTAESPYQIASAEQLDEVRYHLDKHFILTADISLSDYGDWEPIGAFQSLSDAPEDAEVPQPAVAFTGTFDGNHHTISNININKPMSMAVGLFGCTVGTEENPGSISNLNLENVNAAGYYLIGGAVGLQHQNFMVQNVTLTGTNEIQGLQGVGGIIGTSFDTVKNCTAIADIVVTGDDGACAGVVVGGTDGGSLLNCTAAGGSVTATGKNCWALGGVCGAPYAAPKITTCMAENVTITASGTNNRLIGGLVGFTGTYGEDAPTSVTNCTVAGITINVSDSTTCVGGLVGGSTAGSTQTIPSVFAIKDSSTAGAITGGTASVGSIAGYAYHSTVENCTSTMTWNSGILNQIGENVAVPVKSRGGRSSGGSSSSLLTPPALATDSSGNTAGSAVDITFNDDQAWRTAISRLTVDGKVLTNAQYTITAGSIRIIAGVLETPGNHKIAVISSGYSNAVIAQTMTEASIASVVRLAGSNRFETAVAIARAGWTDGADNVVLVYAFDFPDALAAVPLAKKLNAPILLTSKTELSSVTLAEMERLNAKKITLIGSAGVISQNVEDSLIARYGRNNIVRYGGANRYATAAAIAEAMGQTGKAVLVNGETAHYPDALAISPYAAYHGIPILFTEASRLPAETARALTTQNVGAAIIVGGEGAISAEVFNQIPGASRYGGDDRYGTAVAIIKGLAHEFNQVYVVTGVNFPDALVAGNLAAHTQSPLILVDKQIPEAVQTFFTTAGQDIAKITIIGGEEIIPASQISDLLKALE